MEPEVVAFVAALPSMTNVFTRRGRDADLSNTRVNCPACLEPFHMDAMVLLHDEYEGQEGLVMHGLCRNCMHTSLSVARRRHRVHKCPLCRTPCTPALSMEERKEEDTINLIQ
jgi:hypothetical protein